MLDVLQRKPRLARLQRANAHYGAELMRLQKEAHRLLAVAVHGVDPTLQDPKLGVDMQDANRQQLVT